ncbi:MAG: alpha-amylase family glycosyl hydrolase [Chloroflexota bacterium]
MPVPDWVKDAVFYQIFPDRFANGDPKNDPPNVQKWGSPPTVYGFQGGDLRGVIRRLEYLLDLGINAIYFNPIFHSTSNHRYNTTDYYRIDPKLGDEKTFLELLDLAHCNGVRILLDGVFNHSGRGFFAFNDLLENEANSPFRDWYHVKRFPLDAYGSGQAENYLAWWRFRSLPKFNTANPAVRRYLLGVARHWIELGVDGWRLDVPNEIDDDSFWAEFRGTVKQVNPEAYLVGEIWEINPRWVGEDHFDGLMNYPLREALIGWIAKRDLTASAFDERITKLLAAYPQENLFACYLPLGSHDTERIRTLCGGDLRKVRLIVLFQMAFPGAPAVYYGDEIGLEGGKDPDSRRAFPWQKAKWDQEHRRFVQQLISLRRQTPALRHGAYVPLLRDDKASVYAFARVHEGAAVLVVLNASDAGRRVSLPMDRLPWPEGTRLLDALSGKHHGVSQGRVGLLLEPLAGALLLAK